MRVKLKSLQFSEIKEKEVELKVNDLSIDDFNLFISDNAQGKTRFFQALNGMANIFKGKPTTASSQISAAFHFEFECSGNLEKVLYKIGIYPIGDENTFNETIVRGERIIFSSSEKILFNETEQSLVKNFFIPKNLPVLAAIVEHDFVTINLIRAFFQRVVWISSNKSRKVTVSPKAFIPSNTGEDLSSVLTNWKKTYPGIFNEVIHDFKQCFPFIKELFFSRQNIQGAVKADLLTFEEEIIEKSIIQTQWSDGMYRLLFLLMAPKIPFGPHDNIEPPSIVLVDEIENGLDFNRLKYIIRYFQDYSDDSQVLISSHSPLVCDFVHPGNWRVVKRKGAELHFISPKAKEKDLQAQLDLLKHNHWDFYSRHISNSALYDI